MSFRAIIFILLVLGVGMLIGYLLFTQKRARSATQAIQAPSLSPNKHRDRTIQILAGLILFLAAALVAVGYKLYIE